MCLPSKQKMIKKTPMKYFPMSVLIAVVGLGFVGCASNRGRTTHFWTVAKEASHFSDRQDPAKWDMKLFTGDLEGGNDDDHLPIRFGVYPVPDYNLIGEGSFRGVANFGYTGAGGLVKKIGEKTLLFNSFSICTSDVNREFVGDVHDDVFFQIVVLTDFVDTDNYTHLGSLISSRNHPHYVGEGFYKTKNNKIDYLAFINADHDAYAIVNMRYFDLSLGKTILIAPQKDGSLRSMQIQSPAMSNKEIDAYTDQLLQRTDVVDFFTDKGNI